MTTQARRLDNRALRCGVSGRDGLVRVALQRTVAPRREHALSTHHTLLRTLTVCALSLCVGAASRSKPCKAKRAAMYLSCEILCSTTQQAKRGVTCSRTITSRSTFTSSNCTSYYSGYWARRQLCALVDSKCSCTRQLGLQRQA